MTSFRLAPLVACLILLPCAEAVAGDELEALQGQWLVESFEYNATPVAEMLGAVREFSGEKYTLTPKSGESFSGTVKLDVSQSPKQIDLIMPDRSLKGIFEIEGTTLRIAYALAGDARPTELASRPDSGVVLVVHKKSP